MMRRKTSSNSLRHVNSVRISRIRWQRTGTQVQGTGNLVSVDPLVPDLGVDLERAWQLLAVQFLVSYLNVSDKLLSRFD